MHVPIITTAMMTAICKIKNIGTKTAKYQCFVLWWKMRIPRNAPMPPKQHADKSNAFSEMRHDPRLAFHLSMPYMQNVIKEISRMARAGNCQYIISVWQNWVSICIGSLLVMDGGQRWRKWLRQAPLSPLYHKLCNPSRKLRNHKKLFKNLLTKSGIRGII